MRLAWRAERIAEVVSAVTVLALRDVRSRGALRFTLLLDLAFGVVNLIVFLFISRVITHPGPRQPEDYFSFVAAGIVFMLILQAAGTQTVARLAREHRDGTLELLLLEPVPRWAVAVGLAVHPFLGALARAAVYLVVLTVAFDLYGAHASWPAVALMLVTGTVLMMCVGIALMALTLAVGHGEAAARLVVVALSFLSGTYFPPEVLPAQWQTVAVALPTSTALAGFRAALTDGEWTRPAAELLAVVPVLLLVAVCLFQLAVRRLARSGGLAGST